MTVKTLVIGSSPSVVLIPLELYGGYLTNSCTSFYMYEQIVVHTCGRVENNQPQEYVHQMTAVHQICKIMDSI